MHRATLFDGIGLFGQTLKELFIYGPYAQYFSLTTFLDLLPALTHLTIKLVYPFDEMRLEFDQSFNETTERNNQSGNVSNNNMYNLVFLSLDSYIPWNFRIKHIVKRCPRLTYLLDITTVLYRDPSKRYIEFEEIRQLCPSIRYILWGDECFHIRRELEKQWLTLSRKKCKFTDIENTNGYEEREAKHLRQVSFCSDDEEQLISVLKVCLQQSSLSEHLRLSGSMCVDLYQLWNTFKQQNSNLLSQQSQLKSLEFDYLYIPHKLKNTMFFENLFNHFRHIERLNMGLHVIRVDNVDEEQNTISKMVEAIGHQLHQLRCLHISLHPSDKLGSTRGLVDNLVTTLCKCNQKLEILHLSDVRISNDMLLDLCHHSKLHTLSLAGGALYEQLTKDGWISFARKLKEQEQNGYNGGKIQTLVLSCLCSNDVTDEVLEEFAGIKILETLRIEYNDNITEGGINKFASIKSSISKNYKKIELRYCSKVSKDNPHAVILA